MKTPMENRILEINENWHGQTVTLNKGDYLNIKLIENPSTGFSWEISEMDDTQFKVTEDTVSNQMKGEFGASIEKVIQLKALKSGISSLEIIYKRPWEKGSQENKIFIELVVQ
ncbi:protease inhibitor I42 family protein [Cognataquiflexum rubidum]|uniref:protease inhibitor I42 family protein n=1 Tax=Cognataquiflexum rubidum TaxID=2922273 RepID=UPI001F144B5D|nr:protease inhibitor I42 family protein [Cognataquiflexum rubidum]MCH6233432.1 protease inhibitor I42 family protein [Cognataquiflexum rubidum]